MIDFTFDTSFWIALLQIIGIDIVLSGDNAVVIALACRALPQQQQKKAIFFGSMAAIVMRIILALVAVELLKTPYLKLAGGALLLWIGIQLLLPEKEQGSNHAVHSGLAAAIKTILIADVVMSLDNVIAVAAAAKGSVLLLALGLLISIPLIVFGSALLLKVMDRLPMIITLGGALLGYIAGETAVHDPAVKNWVDSHAAFLHLTVPIGGALLVLGAGKWLTRRAQMQREKHMTDLAVLARAEPEQMDPPNIQTTRVVQPNDQLII